MNVGNSLHRPIIAGP